MKRILSLLALTAVAACSAGGASSTLPSATLKHTTSAVFKIKVPIAPSSTSSAARRPKYVSYRVQSVVISGSGVGAAGNQIVANLTPTSTGCSGSPITCSVPFVANVGLGESFTVTAYDAANGTGNVLSTGTVTQTISDGAANAITVTLDPLTSFGSVSFAEYIARGPDGNMWFTTAPFANAVLGKIAPDGTITTYTNGGGLSALEGVVAGPDGNLWFTEGGLGNAGKVVKSDTSGNMTAYGGALKYPSGIAVGSDGNLWVAENGYASSGVNGALAKVTTSGGITQYTAANVYPFAITSGQDGNLWYTDLNTAAIGKVTTAGAITVYGAGTVNNARSIAAGPDGNVWFTESGAIGRITPSGTITTYGAGTVSNPSAIALGPDGNLWFTDEGNGDVGTVAPATGVVTEYGGLGSTSFSNSAAFGSDGNLWIAGGNYIERFVL